MQKRTQAIRSLLNTMPLTNGIITHNERTGVHPSMIKTNEYTA